MKPTNWKLKYQILEWEVNDLKEKIQANISLFNKILAPMLRKDGKKHMPQFLESEFDNQDRKKYHGLRRGDLVDYSHFGIKHKYCIVSSYDLTDNNRIFLMNEDDEIFPAVAADCKIIQIRKVKNEKRKH